MFCCLCVSGAVRQQACPSWALTWVLCPPSLLWSSPICPLEVKSTSTPPTPPSWPALSCSGCRGSRMGRHHLQVRRRKFAQEYKSRIEFNLRYCFYKLNNYYIIVKTWIRAPWTSQLHCDETPGFTSVLQRFKWLTGLNLGFLQPTS